MTCCCCTKSLSNFLPPGRYQYIIGMKWPPAVEWDGCAQFSMVVVQKLAVSLKGIWMQNIPNVKSSVKFLVCGFHENAGRGESPCLKHFIWCYYDMLQPWVPQISSHPCRIQIYIRWMELHLDLYAKEKNIYKNFVKCNSGGWKTDLIPSISDTIVFSIPGAILWA